MDYRVIPGNGMLSNITNDLDLLLTDIHHVYPYPGETTEKPCFHHSGNIPDGPVASFHQEEIKHANLISCTSQLSLSTSDNESTSDSGHDENLHASSSPLQQDMNHSADTGQMPNNGYREISLLERLSKTDAIWLLSNIGRTGAVHLLKDLPTGSFLVRQSSHKNSLALSVQCKLEAKSTVDHYLIENTDRGLRLQGSAYYFGTIPVLIAHYIQNLDELPHRLILPAVIFHAKTSQQLSALAMLGQDFWTSPKSKVSCLSDGAPIHKSCSEPINITRPMLNGSWCQPTMKCSVPSHSVADFPHFMRDNSSQTTSNIESRATPPLVPPKTKAYRGESGVASPDLEDYHQAEGDYHKHTASEGRSIDIDSGVDLTKHIYNQSQTHPRVTPKNKSNLYFTTSLDLVNIPETSYFKSNLSDKLSDYEDIWKNSVCESDNVRNNMCQRLNHHLISDAGIQSVSRVHNDINQHSNNSDKYIDKAKVDNVLACKSFNTSSKHIRLVKTVKASELKTFKTECAHVVKRKPPPLPNLQRIKSSSTSSLATLTSPIYAEPVDAVKLNGKSAVSVRIRRLSAPSGPIKQTESHVSRHPGLETILSPRQVIEERQKFFTFSHQNTRKQRSKRCQKVSRSRSMRTCAEIKSTNQKGWKKKLLKLQINNDHFDNDENQNGHSNEHNNDFDESFFTSESSEINESSSSPLSKFPVYHPKPIDSNRTSCYSESSTVQDLISGALPELTVRPIQPLTAKNVKRVSEYDNLGQYAPGHNYHAPSSVGTVFCNPWDNSLLDNLLSQSIKIPTMDMKEKIQQWQEQNQKYENSPVVTNSNRASVTFSDAANSVISNDVNNVHTNQSKVRNSQHSTNGSSVNDISERCNSCKLSDDEALLINEEVEDNKFVTAELRERMRPIVVSQSSNQSTLNNGPGSKIKEYIFRLSQDNSLIFGVTIDNFVKCTLEGQETDPLIVMRNVRQFMTGIKNYLIKHGEGELQDLIERERSKLGSSEILNIDSLIEGALHVCVIRPLKHYIYKLFVQQYSRNGNLELMSTNIKYARNKTAEEIGIKPSVKPPHGSDMELIKHHLDKMQRAYSPVKKLQNLLAATSTIYHCVQGRQQIPNRGPASLGADDFLPMLIYVLVHSGMVSSEIEADYMWGLLHHTQQNGEGGYYLATFSSAVLVLKNFKQTYEMNMQQQHLIRLPSISDMQGFLKIAIPDEIKGSITWKTLPVRPNMNTKDVCAMIAHKFKITNPQEYSLFLLVKGTESALADNTCPQIIKSEYRSQGEDIFFAYKRIAANIAWPSNMKKPLQELLKPT